MVVSVNSRVEKFLLRYIFDCKNTIKQMQSLLVSKGNLIIVVGNSTQYGTRILNDKIFRNSRVRLSDSKLVDSRTRRIRRQSRYLPITNNGQSDIQQDEDRNDSSFCQCLNHFFCKTSSFIALQFVSSPYGVHMPFASFHVNSQ